MKKMRKAAVSGVALLATSAMLAACGSAPDEESAGGGEDSGPSTDFVPCMVSDSGGFDDKSFNQLGFEGLQKASDELGAEMNAVESNGPNDFAPNLESLVGEGCDLIISVGFALSAATVESANANPDIEYVLIDDPADNDFDGTKDADNIKPLLYDTAQAAFMAGYAAADYSKTGVVGTYGGMEFPTVTIFMDGYRQGVEYYNSQKDADVQVKGWDGKTGTFTGSFEDDPAATQTATQLLDQKADVVLPVGGPIYKGALSAIADTGDDAVMIGTDADVFESDPSTQDVILTSVQKGIDVSTYEAVMSAGNDDFDPEAYIGTLENDGVGIAPFHNYEDQVSDTLTGELDDIKAGIIDGSIPVTSYLNP